MDTSTDKLRKEKGTGRVYLRGNTWWIRYSVRGQRRDESSGSASQTDAEGLLDKRLRQLAAGIPIDKLEQLYRRPKGTGRVYQRNDIWWIRYSMNGERKDESSGSSVKKEAENLLKVRLGAVATGTVAAVQREKSRRVKELLELVRTSYRSRNRRSLKDLESRLDSTIMPVVGHKRAAEFGPRDIDQYITERREAGAADATINRELAIIRRAFKLAVQQKPPMIASAPHFELIGDIQNAREGFIEYPQYKTLIDALPGYLKCLTVVAYHLGMRKGELLNLKWSQVDLKNGVIRLSGKQTKSGEARTAPIYGDMMGWLQMEHADHLANWKHVPYVFHIGDLKIGPHLGRRGSGPRSKKDATTAWREACIAAGIPELLFHDLRRSAVNNMEQAGVPRKVAMSITGHKTESVYRRYNIVRHRDVHAAGEQLQALMDREAERLVPSDKGDKNREQGTARGQRPSAAKPELPVCQ